MSSDDAWKSGPAAGEWEAGELYPLLLEPLLVERIWGADRLGRLHGLAGEPGIGAAAGPEDATPSPRRTPIGESWLLCDDNQVRNGRWAGQRVVDVIADLGGHLLGSANVRAYGMKLALMAKFLDAAADLSIQVHPDDDYASTHESVTGHLGKAEAWYVIDAEPGAAVVWGLRRPLTEEQVRAAVADGTLGDSLNRVPVVAGDVIVNPAGTVHAVGAGLQLFEIQQSSDLTYRLYDYGRRDAAGNLRALHLDKALAVADLGRADPAAGLGAVVGREPEGHPTRVAIGWRLLVDTPQFTLESALVGAGARSVSGATLLAGSAAATAGLDCTTHASSFDLLVTVTGSLNIEPLSRDGGAAFGVVALGKGDAALLPAALGPYRLTGTGEVLRSRVGSSG